LDASFPVVDISAEVASDGSIRDLYPFEPTRFGSDSDPVVPSLADPGAGTVSPSRRAGEPVSQYPPPAALAELRTDFAQDLPFFGFFLFSRPRRELPMALELEVKESGYVSLPEGRRLSVTGLTFGDFKAQLLRELRKSYAHALTPEKLSAGKTSIVRPSRKRPFLHSVAPSAPTGVTRPVGIPPHISVDY
jgi:hypothetical protein